MSLLNMTELWTRDTNEMGQVRGQRRGSPAGHGGDSLAASGYGSYRVPPAAISRVLRATRKINHAGPNRRLEARNLIASPGPRLSWHAEKMLLQVASGIAGGFIGRQPVISGAATA
jgi:hypothetical protein